MNASDRRGRRRKILQIRPDFGGLLDYGNAIKAVYELAGYDVTALDCPMTMPAAEILERIESRESDLVHFEVGVGQANFFWASLRLSLTSGRKQMATLHDPGVVVAARLERFDDRPHLPRSVRFPTKVARRLTHLTLHRAIIPAWVRSRRVPKLYLRPDLAEKFGGYYLPQPTYHQAVPASRVPEESPLRVGFAGYWGRLKGVETLIDAAARCKAAVGPAFTLVLAGGGVTADDEFVARCRRQAEALGVPLEMPGFVPAAEMAEFLQRLSVLVLPYWPELPSGTSAMSMRAAELGTPIIASNTPALSEQLGPDGARYVTPRDATALSEALIDFLRNPAPFRQAAARTQRAMFAEHGWQVVAEILDETVQRILRAD